MAETAYQPMAAPADRPPILIKGNDAIVKGAILAGCSCYFGY